MINLSQQDLNVRLQLTQCCISTLTNELLVKIKVGAKDVDCKLKDLQVVQEMLEALKCYNILTDEITETDNCLSEEQVQSMFDYIASKCKTCFQYPGFNYIDTNSSEEVITETIYYGSSSNPTLINEEILDLQNSIEKIAFSGSYLTNANNYKYISYPTSLGTATSFKNTLNGLDVPMIPLYYVTIDGVLYNVHRSFYPIVGAVAIQIS